jgi:hypothetical protein
MEAVVKELKRERKALGLIVLQRIGEHFTFILKKNVRAL